MNRYFTCKKEYSHARNLPAILILVIVVLLVSCTHIETSPPVLAPTPQLGVLPPRIPAIPEVSEQSLTALISEKESDPFLPVIVIDPGHGGQDNGAEGQNGLLEKDITLQMALSLKEKIEAEIPAKVILTRYYDEFIPLDLRASLANYNQAAVFISIHTNAAYHEHARGVETFFLSLLPSDKEAERVASFENSVIRYESGGKEKYEELQQILMDILQNEIQRESAVLAEYIQLELAGSLETKNRGVRQAPFYVLVGTHMPAALVEVGFITNSKEAKMLTDDEYQAQVVESIFRGLIKFRDILKIRLSG